LRGIPLAMWVKTYNIRWKKCIEPMDIDEINRMASEFLGQ
jgi:hypothetical protein